jgi:transketolase
MTDQQLDQLSINTIRTLSMDAVQQAKSGHPGTPMALAPLVYTLWNRLRFDPQDPIWPNRDRFVLSNGHASMLLWSVLHLTRTQAVDADYEILGHPSVSLDDIRRFRQLSSRAPGHPEYHWVSGVETTTGPLGQGVATSVGMAIAQKWLANRYNKPGFSRRHPLTRGLDAVVGYLRPPAEGIPGYGVAARREGAPRRRGSLNVRLGAVRR